MAEQSPMADDRRPTVRILTCGFNGQQLEPILWGLEEDGIPADIQKGPNDGAVALAKQAAHMSPLNVGIGISGIDGKLALHHRDLAAEPATFRARHENRNIRAVAAAWNQCCALGERRAITFRL